MNSSQAPAQQERGAAVSAALEPLQAEGCAAETAAPLLSSTPIFKPLNKEAPIEKTRRFLPHWEQEGCTYFITWRMADSMPAAKLRQWKAERDHWLRQHPKPWDDATWKEYHHTFEGPMQQWLDAGHGSCVLRQPALREIIASSFRHYDGQHYHMGDYVIMPNHVHVLVTPLPGHTHRQIVAAWKRYTGHEVLKLTRGEPPFWLEEQFDHAVRSPAQLAWYRRYIRENPEKAFLKPGQWTHWEHPMSTAQLCGLPESKSGAAVPAAPTTQANAKDAAETAAPHFASPLLILLALLFTLGSTHAQTDFARPATSAEFDLNTITTSASAAKVTGEFNLDTRAQTPNLAKGETRAFPIDTQNGALASLTTTGPTQAAAGTISTFECHLVKPNQPAVRVTNQATWSFAGQPPTGVRLLQNTLTLPASVPVGTQVQVRAAYTHLSIRLTSPVQTVTVTGSSLTASATASWVAPNTALQAVTLKGQAFGGQSPYTLRWDVDGDGTYGDVTGSEVTTPFARPVGTYRLALEVTDAAGIKARAATSITLDKPPVPGQPVRLRPTEDAGLEDLHGSPGQAVTFDSSKIGNGCVILTHGLRSNGFEPWIQDMALRINSRLVEDGPNVVIYNWSSNADPGGAPVELISDFIVDVTHIRSAAQTQGQLLAALIWEKAKGATPKIDPREPLHLIGHSAGGFVMGEAGLWLKRNPLPNGSLATKVAVARVTMLDTPFPYYDHLVTLPNPAHVEQVISSFYGNLEFPSTWFVKQNAYYSVKALPGFERRFSPGVSGHGLAYRWYSRTIRAEGETDGAELDALGSGGFNLSAWGGAAPANAVVPRGGNAGAPAIHTVPVSGWETFGQVNDAGTYWTLTEEANAGLKTNVVLPVGATSLRLTAQFTGATEGDFLCIRFGEEPDLYHVLNTEITREDFAEVSVSVEAYGGESGLLVIELISRGGADAVVKVGKEISFTVLDDADADGLTTTQEIALGLLSDDPDTDGDGLLDGTEVQETHTDPALADSDGDGDSDQSEINAGTDPLANGSFFRITEVSRMEPNQLTLRWKSVPGRNYRVSRSVNLDRLEYEIISPEVQGIGESTEWQGVEPPGGERAFFWIEAIPAGP